MLPVIPRIILDPIQNLEIINDEQYLISRTRQDNFSHFQQLHTELKEVVKEYQYGIDRIFRDLLENPSLGKVHPEDLDKKPAAK